MITNSDGYVALKRYTTINKIVTVEGEQYAFITRANICMAWIKSDHVNAVLAIKKVCCGGNKRSQFRYANENDARRWSAGGGR